MGAILRLRVRADHRSAAFTDKYVRTRSSSIPYCTLNLLGGEHSRSHTARSNSNKQRQELPYLGEFLINIIKKLYVEPDAREDPTATAGRHRGAGGI